MSRRALARPSHVDGDLIRRHMSVAAGVPFQDALVPRTVRCQSSSEICELSTRETEVTDPFYDGIVSPIECAPAIRPNGEDVHRTIAKAGTPFKSNSLDFGPVRGGRVNLNCRGRARRFDQ
jgi:hypothetical protein